MFLRHALVFSLSRGPRSLPRFATSKSSEIIYEEEDRIVCDFQKLEIVGSRIDSLVVVNNLLNQEWLYKGLKAAENVVLADGGANRFYNTPYRHWRNVRSIVGDFDSLRPEVEAFYKARGV